jgi:hypothetical protein
MPRARIPRSHQALMTGKSASSQGCARSRAQGRSAPEEVGAILLVTVETEASSRFVQDAISSPAILAQGMRSLVLTLVLLGCSTDDAAGGGGTGGADSGGADSGGGAPLSEEFMALTYNVAGLPEALTGAPDPLTRMPLIGDLLGDYDLVLTQEDWQTPDPNPLAPIRVYHEILDERAPHPYRSIPMPLPLGSDPDHWPATENRPAQAALVSDGLNAFSKIPFDPAKMIRVGWLDCYGDANVGAADCLSTKGFTVMTLTFASGVELDVIDVHGEAGRTTEDLRLMRAHFEQLTAFLDDPARAGRAMLLGGDTNLHTERPISETAPDAEIWQALLDATGFVDVCDTATTGITCSPERDGHFIDKFAFKNGDEVTLEPLSHAYETEKFTYAGGYLSDHDPLAVRFRVGQH